MSAGDPRQFPCGWLGNCRVGKWMPDSDAEGGWTCKNDGEATITVQMYPMNNVAGKKAGIGIEWSEMQKWEDVYGVPPHGNSNADPVEVKAQCWEGKLSEKPSNTDNIVNLETQVTKGDKTYAVGEIPDQNGASQNRYSCIYGFEQYIYWDLPSNQPNTRGTIFYQGEEEIGHPTSSHAPSSAPSNFGYLVAGTNQEIGSPIKTTNVYIDPPQDLQEQPSITTTSDLWTQFPSREQTGGFGSREIRNPLDDCIINGRCPGGEIDQGGIEEDGGVFS